MRGGRAATLTDLGASFLPYACRALLALEDGVTAARQARAGQRGRVAIGVLESLSGSFLGPALARYHAAHPAVDLLVRAGRHEPLVELLVDGVISLALIAWPCPEAHTAGLEVLLTLREPVVLVAAPAHPLARRAPVDEAAVAAAARPFLLLRWWLDLPPAVERLARRAGPATIDVPMDTGRQLVISGAGAGFFPWRRVTDLVAAGLMAVVPVLDLPPLERTSALVRRAAAAPLSPAAEALAAAVRQRAEELRLLA